MTTGSTSRLRFLDDLRALGMVMVVGVHALGYGHPMPPELFDIFRFFIHTVSVPVFFMVDGYLMASRAGPTGRATPYGQVVRRSALRLLLPWLLFSVLYAVLRYVFERVGLLSDALLVGHGPMEILTAAWGSLYAPQLYFLVSLFLIRLATPWLRRFARIESDVRAGLVYVAFYAGYRMLLPVVSPVLQIEGGQEPLLHGLWGLQYVLFGMIGLRLVRRFESRRIVLAALVLLLLAVLLVDRRGEAGRTVLQYCYLLALLAGFTMQPGGGSALVCTVVGWIGRNTMGLYLVHVPVLMKMVSLPINRLVSDPVASFLAILVLTFGVSCALVGLVNRIPGGELLWGTLRRR